MAEDDFHGAKIALICGDLLLVYLRDDFVHIPYPAHWDIPGGGRENCEDPEACALRELEEEFGISLDPGLIQWCRRYAPGEGTPEATYFMAATLPATLIESIKFGSEGQRWALMSLVDFLDHECAVPHLQQRLADYLRAVG